MSDPGRKKMIHFLIYMSFKRCEFTKVRGLAGVFFQDPIHNLIPRNYIGKRTQAEALTPKQ